MKTTNTINPVLTLLLIATTSIFTVSCNKESLNESLNKQTSLSAADDENASSTLLISPWKQMSSGVSGPDIGIIEMAEPFQNQTTCYGIIYNGHAYPALTPTHDITITHDGGETWHAQTIGLLADHFLFGVAATTNNTVHVIGWNYLVGGGKVLRSTDGGQSWHREGANTFTNPASFPDIISFFTHDNGVMFGDPVGEGVNRQFEIYTTCDGGNNWKRVSSSKVPAPLPNEIGATFLADRYNNSIWVVTPISDNNGKPVNARLLQSDDMGATWYVRNAHLPFATNEGTVKFRNHNVGLFKNNHKLYRTTDGGNTWKAVNYSGKWFSFDFDNVPGKDGWWVSTGGNWGNIPGERGSSISYDDGDHWSTLDNKNHTCVDMVSATRGYSGGISTNSGNDGVFVYYHSN
jgi:photosystem II stability/assembly factor-like uncharacterized protein